jgi:hypothetical protein
VYPKLLRHKKARTQFVYLAQNGYKIANTLRRISLEHGLFQVPPMIDTFTIANRILKEGYNLENGSSLEVEAFTAERIRLFPMNELEREKFRLSRMLYPFVNLGQSLGLFPLFAALIQRWIEEIF